MNFEAPLTSLVWLTSFVSIAITYVISYFIIPTLGADALAVVEAGHDYFLRHAGGRADPGTGEGFTSTESRHVREVVVSAQEGGASLGILSGFVAGNFSAYYLGLAMMFLMSIAYYMSTMGLAAMGWSGAMLAPAVFAFGLVAFGFLGMGPVTIAVDSYGPVTDNAQSVYELSLIEQVPNIEAEIKKDFNFSVDFERAKDLLEANDGAGNTFKATAKPVLIGTAVVGATTMIFSIIMALTHGLTDAEGVAKLSLLQRAVFPRTDHRRRDDLLVHRRFHAGRDHRRLSRRRVHQSQHQTRKRRESFGRRQQEGGGDLHASTRRRAC